MDQCLLQDDYNIGNNLRKLRIKANLTQQEVATKLEIMGIPMSREIYAQIESGRHHIKYRVFIGLKEIFNATYEDMLEGTRLS